jgi:uncharacterized protein
MHDDLAGLCSSELLRCDPDIARLRGEIRKAMHVSHGEASRILYNTVLSINRSLFYPVSQIELMLAEGCNLACRYCFEAPVFRKRHRRKQIMSEDVIRASIDLLHDYSGPDEAINVTLFGGEPLLNIDGVKFATEYAEERFPGRSLALNITTNGTLLTDEVLAFLSRHRISVLLSIDGLAGSHDRYRIDKKGRGTFDAVAAALARLKTHQPWVGVRMTIMPSEAGALFDNVRGLYDLGVNQFVIGHVSDAAWPKETVETLVDQYRVLRDWYRGLNGHDVKIDDFDEPASSQAIIGCRAARTNIAVSADGTITGCSRISTLDAQARIGMLGDVTHGLYAIRNRQDMAGCAKLHDALTAAGLADTYRGGCFATNYEEHKDVFSPNLAEYEIKNRLEQVCKPA